MDFKKIFKMKNTTYDKLKYTITIIIPAIFTMIGAIGVAINWEPTTIVLTIGYAVNYCLGTILGISTEQYNNENNL